MQYIIKIILSALIIFWVSELGKKFTPIAGILASLPLVSILAMIWLYNETNDIQKIVDLSYSIFLAVIPSLLFFLILPFLLKNGISFIFSIIISSICMFLIYSFYIFILSKFWIKI